MGGDNSPLTNNSVCKITQVINFELISVEIIVHCMVVVFKVDFFFVRALFSFKLTS